MQSVNRRKVLVGSALALMIVASVLLVAGAADGSSSLLRIHNHGFLPTDMRGPFQHLDISVSGGQSVALLVVLFACYLAILAGSESVPVRLVIAAIVALHLIFALAPPLLSSDLFGYVGFARLEVVHDLNPYRYAPAYAPDDPIYPFVGLKLHTTPYGPLFTLLSLPVGWLSPAAAIWALKSAFTLASLGCVALVAACARRLGRDPLQAALFVGLNPVLLVFAVGGGHNDLLVMLFALSGILLLLRGSLGAGIAGLVAASASKLSAGLLLPFAVLGSADRRRALIWAVGTAVAGVAIALLVFGTTLVSVREEFDTQADLSSPNDIPGAINDLLGLGLSNFVLSRIGIGVFAIVVCWLLVRAYRGADWVQSAGWATFTLLVTTTWFLPWYLVWFLPLAAISAGRNQKLAALALTALVIGLQASSIA
ncbi:MAG: DUF2029 domain-containing protein [Actinomycetota bacterium]|nr:DUF2029 domain-containing protein [Actinomycetota bacterium]